MPATVLPEIIDITSSPEPFFASGIAIKPPPSLQKKARSRSDFPRAGASNSAVGKARTRSSPLTIIDLSNESEDSPFTSPSKRHGINSPGTMALDLSSASGKEKGNTFDSWISSGVEDHGTDASCFAATPHGARMVDDLDLMLASVLEILPDVLPAHALMLLRQLEPTYKQNTAHAVIQYLFDHEYPKVERDRGKRKREDSDEPAEVTLRKKGKTDYESILRPYPSGTGYSVLAEEQLFEDFPLVPRAHVRKVMEQCNYFYAPAHLRLLQESQMPTLPYVMKSRPTPLKAKGKGRATYDADFEKEREWLVRKLEEDKLAADQELAEKLNQEEYDTIGGCLECGCCFGEYPFDKLVQCAEGHLFCRDCARRQAETSLGLRQPELLCMDQSDCKAPFPESEIARFLPEKTLKLYHRIKQEKEIQKAGLEGLESCPFCDYACVIENDEEKLFRCENEECLVISCRKCKKQDHLPRSCKEVEDDTRLDARHAVEEAMTNALMRKCPKCHHPFIKEAGCNKMTCNQCRTLSCYICRKVVNGYDHFNQLPGAAPGGALKDPNKCPLWDTNLDRLHAEEVAAAARQAQDEILSRAKNGDIRIHEKDLEVELPKAPPTPPGPGPGQPGYNGGILPAEFLPPHHGMHYRPPIPPPQPVLHHHPPHLYGYQHYHHVHHQPEPDREELQGWQPAAVVAGNRRAPQALVGDARVPAPRLQAEQGNLALFAVDVARASGRKGGRRQ